MSGDSVPELRVIFGKRRDRGIIAGRTVGQAAFIALAIGLLIIFVRSFRSGPHPLWWWLVAAVFTAPIGFIRFGGRAISEVAPAAIANAVVGLTGQREYRNGVHRRLASDTANTPRTEPRLPGPLAKVEILGFTVGDSDVDGGEVGVAFDRADGSVVVVMEVTGQTYPLLDTVLANSYAVGFQRLLDALSARQNPIVAIQCLERIIPDLGEEAAREWNRRGGRGSEFSQNANESLLASEAGRGIVHESYIAIRINPGKARRLVRESGRGDLGKASVAFRFGAGVRSDLEAAGVKVVGWLPPRGLSAVLRSAFDPSADAMVARRGGGAGDSAGGDGGLPSGVSPATAGPMTGRPARTYYDHNNQVSRTWWIEEFPRAASGVIVGFMQPLLLNVPCRHTVSILLEPLDSRAAARRIEEAVSTQDAAKKINQRIGRRSTRAAEREVHDTDRNEAALVEGFANFHVKVVVTVTAGSVPELEDASAQIEAALNGSNMEGSVWTVETDQAFYIGALPLARGIS
ncbi:hypothetical protein ABIB25_000952 [Nakamurella sp. UYEF19]|uniref:SCO6880 family protein n=1 Tax=Nakamurella sp. UYEF19 TaxID=1756392 RepID=UPI003392E20B